MLLTRVSRHSQVHLLSLTLYKLDEVVGGELDSLIVPLRQEHQADLLAAMAEE